MNNKMLVATIATVAAIATGIYYYSTKNKNVESDRSHDIIGLWMQDSSVIKPNSLAANWLINKDSVSKKTFEFKADSTLLFRNDSTSVNYFVYDDILVLKDTVTTENYILKWINDSSITIAKDSTLTLYLSKKK
jgi:hypothetical protein